MSLIFLHCSTTTVEPVQEPKHPPVVKQEVPEHGAPQNPCTTFSKLSPRMKDEAETAYTLYRDQIKLNNLEGALTLWKKAYELAPAANGRVTYQFDDGVAIYKHLFSQTNDDQKKRSYMDTIISIYNKRAECFGEEAYIAARKAFDNYYFFNGYSDEDETFELFKTVMDSMGTDAEYFVINPFTKMLYDKVVTETIEIPTARKYALLILETVRKGLENCTDNCEAWGIINEYAPQRLEVFEGIKSFYSCAYYENKYYDDFLRDPENCDTINEVHRKLLWGGCGETTEYLTAVSEAKETHCYTPPPPEGPLRRAFNAYDEGEFRDAIRLFREFVDRTEDTDKKGRYTLLIAKIYYRDMKDYPAARRFALEAARYIPNWGEPFMLVGKLYASSGPLCGPGRGWDSQIVTWPAIDKFEHAKSIDSSVAEEANRLIRQYRQYMPSVEDIFQRPDINEGNRFFVPCWIQEWTTIRAARS